MPIADRPIPSLPPWARHTLGRLRRLLASPPLGLGCALRLGLRPRLCSGCGASTPGNGPPCTPWHPSPLRTGVLPLRPPGAAESVVPLAVVESTFGSTIPRQAFCSHRSVVGSPPLAFGHSPGCAPSPDRCRHPSCHPFPTGLELMLAVVRLVLAPLPRSLRRRASLGALPSASSLFLADRGRPLDSGVAPRLPFLSDRRRPPPITATGRSPDRVASPLS